MSNITIEEIVNIYPFIDELVTVQIDGKALKELLEYSASLTYDLAQFSGVEATYDFSKAIGERVVKGRINGEKIKADGLYSIACSAFVAGGGDGYTMLKNGKVLARSEPKFIDFLLEHIEQEEEVLLPEVGRQKALGQ